MRKLEKYAIEQEEVLNWGELNKCSVQSYWRKPSPSLPLFIWGQYGF